MTAGINRGAVRYAATVDVHVAREIDRSAVRHAAGHNIH